MLLIDVSMLVRRCYAKLSFLTNSEGVPTGIEFGTLRTLEMLQRKYPDQEIVLCFDSPKCFKREWCSEYKANRRQLDKSFYERFEEFKKFLRCLYANLEIEGLEADELMFSIAKTIPGLHFIYTNDHDLLQAISLNVKVLKSFHSKRFVWDVDKVKQEYGVDAAALPTYFAFTGDKVDNITGVPRIPKHSLACLINWTVDCELSIDEMLTEIKTAGWSPNMKTAIAEFIDSGRWHLNYELIKLKTIDELVFFELTRDDDLVINKLKEWEIYSLLISKKYNLIGNDEF